MNPTFDSLKTRLAEITDLRMAGSLLGWDQQVMMPPAAAATRAEQLATLGRMAHELFVATETERLLDELRPYEESLDPDSDEASLIRVTRQDFEKAARVPPELRAELTRASAQGYQVWLEARAQSDFERFLPSLERNLELKQRYVECFPPAQETYDVLLDDYERGAKTADVRRVFEELRDELVPLIAEIADDVSAVDDSFLHEGPFPFDAQRELSHEVVELFGFRKGAWRLDPTAHPFASGGGTSDIRITTHYSESSLESLFATMHEYGHGLYEHQVAPGLERTPLARGVSLGLHESQSRMWENLVGRSRPFWHFFFRRVQALFPEPLEGIDAETMFRAVNRVRPSLIRIHADEVTYNLHVILRFELEQELIDGRIDLRRLPEEWNRRMWEYLRVEVPNDALGVLQDMHWSGGAVGYFPTYSLGNVMSVQIWERLKQDLPQVEDGFERGEFAPLREWLGEHLHRHGRKFTPTETLERVVGGPLDAGPYLRYLREKHGTVTPVAT